MSLLKLLASGKSLIGLKDTPTRYRMSQRHLLPKFGAESNPFSSRDLPAAPSAAGPQSVSEPQPDLPGAGVSGATKQTSCNEPRNPAPGLTLSGQKTSNIEHRTSNIEFAGKAPQFDDPGSRRVHGEMSPSNPNPDSVPTAAMGPVTKPVQKVAQAPKLPPAAKTGSVVPRFDRAPEENGFISAAKWMGENAHKLNPLEWLPKRHEPARPTIKLMARVPVQGELSLDNVKVVRNDLSDTDVEVVTARSGARTNPAPAESKPEVAESRLI